MKTSNLALRMDAVEAPAETPEAALERPAVHDDAARRPRFEVRAFERRTFERRAIVLRDPGLPPFRVR